MPYIIKKAKDKEGSGYKVCKRDEPTRCFSKHPLSEEKAKRQRTAIIMSEMGMSRSRSKGGNSGYDDEAPPEEPPKTILLIQNALIRYEIDEAIGLKLKKAEWEKLYKDNLPKMRENYARSVEQSKMPSKSLAKDAADAFRKLNIR